MEPTAHNGLGRESGRRSGSDRRIEKGPAKRHGTRVAVSRMSARRGETCPFGSNKLERTASQTRIESRAGACCRLPARTRQAGGHWFEAQYRPPLKAPQTRGFVDPETRAAGTPSETGVKLTLDFLPRRRLIKVPGVALATAPGGSRRPGRHKERQTTVRLGFSPGWRQLVHRNRQGRGRHLATRR
jgi:hypothetical protein